MKFVRPLYRELFFSEMGKQLAVDTFTENCQMQVAYYRMNAIRFLPLPLLITVFFLFFRYHPIARKLLFKQLLPDLVVCGECGDGNCRDKGCCC